MNTPYLVELMLEIDGMEKYAHTLVRAENKQDANKIALKSECHYDCDLDEDWLSCTDGGSHTYTVRDTKAISESDAKCYERLTGQQPAQP